jgi:hypothetical protein
LITSVVGLYFTYDHRTLKIRLPVRSAIYKQCTGGLVVRWVTTSESPLLYVFGFLLVFFFGGGLMEVESEILGGEAGLGGDSECPTIIELGSEANKIRTPNPEILFNTSMWIAAPPR